MKIQPHIPIPFQPLSSQNQLVQDELTAVVQPIQHARKAALQEAQQQLAAIQAANYDTGEEDPKAQHLMEKFKSGKKLTPEEMAYIRKYAPGMVDYIDKIMREREMMELSMKLAPTKNDVQLVALNAAKQINKNYTGEDLEIRLKHLADAKHEYEKTDEYREKPLHLLDDRPHKKRLWKRQEEPMQPVVNMYKKQQRAQSSPQPKIDIEQ